MRYTHGTERLCGIALPLAGIRTEGGWRTGEYPDLAELGALCGKAGIGMIQLLPVNDTGDQPSPYFALSAFALHPLYLRAKDLPEAGSAPEALRALDEFSAAGRPGERFPYAEALRIKDAALRSIYQRNADDPGLLAELEAFARERSWVRPYAVYKRLKETNERRSWLDWHEHQDPSAQDIVRLWEEPRFRNEHLFHVWTQLRCYGQFSKAAGALRTMGIELMGDLPILMNEDSADVWSRRSSFRMELRAGSPPDGESPLGQNWGFPIYDWAAMAADGYRFWKSRIEEADRFYSAYRIDHVLGFFRIWALPEREESAALGRFEPGASLPREKLQGLGFSDERIRWLSEPHVSGGELYAVAARCGIPDEEARRAVDLTLDRIGNEDLFLFKDSIRGEKDLAGLRLAGALESWLKERWRDRALVKSGDGYAPAWSCRSSRAWASLSEGERASLEHALAELSRENGDSWIRQGKGILSMLASASEMLPCAEDLGAIPDGVPQALASLGMLGLRLPRWTRRWNEHGQPYISLRDYPELSVCTPSVHDTTTLRDWWRLERGREAFAMAYCPVVAGIGEDLDCDAQYELLRSLAGSSSRICMLQAQDLLDLEEGWRSEDPAWDRVNIPGTTGEFNWTWRMKPSVGELEGNARWLERVRGIAQARSRR